MIVQFKPRSKTNRVKALMKGQIKEFTCNTCGEDFEVLFNDRPDKCPNCGLYINWVKSKEEDDAWSE